VFRGEKYRDSTPPDGENEDKSRPGRRGKQSAFNLGPNWKKLKTRPRTRAQRRRRSAQRAWMTLSTNQIG